MGHMSYAEIMTELDALAGRMLGHKDRVLISVVGKNGCGKSHFGRHVRKRGLGRLPRRIVTVIDDGTMFESVLVFFKRRVRIPTTGVDELAPFLERLPNGKRIIFYINNSPARRISRADILLKLSTDEETRRERLERRYGQGSEKFRKYFYRDQEENFGITYSHVVEAEL